MSVSKYPVQPGDSQGITDGVNYLLSGPAGLGQNFTGFSTYTPAYLRPTFRQPFVTPITGSPVPIYGFTACNNATGCDTAGNPVFTLTRYARYDFAVPFAVPPYQAGDTVIAQNFTPTDYDSGGQALVYACTTTYLIIQYNSEYVFNPYVSGGEVGTDRLNVPLSTDCNGRVTVNGGTDRVFVSGQLLCDIDYSCTVPSEFDVIVRINRYTGYLSAEAGSTDYVFNEPITTVAQRLYHYSVGAPGTITDLETVFTQFIDGPDIPFGYYWYILEWEFVTQPTYANIRPGVPITGPYVDAALTGVSVPQNTSYFALTPTTVTGSGFGLTVDIDIDTTDSTAYARAATVATVLAAGSNYQVGDTLSIDGSLLGGASGVNDMTLTITQIQYPGDATAGVVTLGLRSLTAQVVKQ